MDYRGYWISVGYYNEVKFWLGGESDYDAEYDQEGWSDNATNADSIEDAKFQIDELILETA